MTPERAASLPSFARVARKVAIRTYALSAKTYSANDTATTEFLLSSLGVYFTIVGAHLARGYGFIDRIADNPLAIPAAGGLTASTAEFIFLNSVLRNKDRVPLSSVGKAASRFALRLIRRT